MDIVLTLLLVYYLTQTGELLLRKFLDPGKSKYLLFLPALLVISFFFGGSVFLFMLMFVLVFWSRACRASDYGLSYHFLILVAGGIVWGPVAGFILGFLPRFFIPVLRPDAQVLDIYLGAIVLGTIGAISGLAPSLIQAPFTAFALTALVLYNIIRVLMLFGKYPMSKVTIASFVNIGINYYLITYYLGVLIQYLGGA